MGSQLQNEKFDIGFILFFARSCELHDLIGSQPFTQLNFLFAN